VKKVQFLPRPIWGRSVAGLSVALLVLLVLVAASAARADEIAYSCGYDICTIDPDNTATHVDLTETENTEFEPAWSPDGGRLAFNGNDNSERLARVYTISATEPKVGALEVIDGNGIGGGEPTWSPDGTKIAFSGGKEPFTSELGIYVSPSDGTSAPQLIGGYNTEERNPAWSPNNSLLAFERGVSTWISAPDESATPYPLASGLGGKPAWSPDGTRIATVTAGVPPKIRLIDADNDGGFTEMPVAAEDSSNVEWSPDGSHVVYVDANDQVRIAPTDPPGEGFEISLPHEVGVPLEPSFSPEGNRIVLGARELQSGGLNRIYVAPAAGGEAVRVTEAPMPAIDPVWKPVPGASSGSGSGSGGGVTGGSSSGGANPPATRAPVIIQLAAFRHPYFNTGFLMAAYVPCSLGSTNAVCHASGEATYVSPTYDSSIAASRSVERPAPKPLVIAKGSVTVPSGQTKPLPLKLTAAGKKLAKQGKPLKVTVKVVETAPGAKPKTTTKTLTVKPLPKKH
jgi:dipeptidyl aminopeptidase/acylaminoacyl peptidase